MKLITDDTYGHQRAYVGAIAVVWQEGSGHPSVAVCSEIREPDRIVWLALTHASGNSASEVVFQADPSKLRPGEWCWPVVGNDLVE